MPVLATLNVPDAATITRVVNGLTTDYLTTIPDPANPGQRIPNPETRLQYAVRRVREWIAAQVVAAETIPNTPAAPTIT